MTATAQPNLLGVLGQNLYNSTYKLFGGRVPGSAEDKQYQLQMAELDKRIQDIDRSSRTPQEKQQELSSLISLVSEGRDKAERDAWARQLDQLPALTALRRNLGGIKLDELDRSTRINTGAELARIQAGTAADIDRMRAAGGVSKDLLGTNIGGQSALLRQVQEETGRTRDAVMGLAGRHLDANTDLALRQLQADQDNYRTYVSATNRQGLLDNIFRVGTALALGALG